MFLTLFFHFQNFFNVLFIDNQFLYDFNTNFVKQTIILN